MCVRNYVLLPFLCLSLSLSLPQSLFIMVKRGSIINKFMVTILVYFFPSFYYTLSDWTNMSISLELEENINHKHDR